MTGAVDVWHGHAGTRPEQSRRRNLATVMRYLHRHGATPRSDLTRVMGLNRSTMGALVSELLELRLIHEEAAPPDRSRVGRPSPVLRADESGVDARPRHLPAALGDAGRRVGWRWLRALGLGGPRRQPGPELLGARLAPRLRAVHVCGGAREGGGERRKWRGAGTRGNFCCFFAPLRAAAASQPPRAAKQRCWLRALLLAPLLRAHSHARASSSPP